MIMDILKTLFPDTAALRRYVAGVHAGNSVDSLVSVMPSVTKRITSVLPQPLLQRVIKAAETSAEAQAVRSAFANLLMLKFVTFDAVEKRKSGGTDVYKYELEAMRREYADNFYSAMDTLLEVVSTSDEYKDEWAKSRWAHLLSNVPIRSCTDFDDIYPIDLSYHFFFRILPFQREVYLEYASLFAKLKAAEESDPDEVNYADLTSQMHLAFAKVVISLALLRFDITELPMSIRNLFDDQRSLRTGYDPSTATAAIASRLRAEAEASFSAVVAVLSDSHHSGGSGVYATESDKIVLLA